MCITVLVYQYTIEILISCSRVANFKNSPRCCPPLLIDKQLPYGHQLNHWNWTLGLEASSTKSIVIQSSWVVKYQAGLIHKQCMWYIWKKSMGHCSWTHSQQSIKQFSACMYVCICMYLYACVCVCIYEILYTHTSTISLHVKCWTLISYNSSMCIQYSCLHTYKNFTYSGYRT